MSRIIFYLFAFTLITLSNQAKSQNDNADVIPPVLNLLLDAEPGSFSGTISLPPGVNAGAGGVIYNIGVLEFVFIDGIFSRPIDAVIIPEGQNSADYQFDLLSADGNHVLNFECTSGCEGLDVTTDGFWSESLGVVGSFIFGATRFSAAVDNEVDIVMESADTFSGTVSLPSGITGNDFTAVVVRVRDTGFLQFDSYSTIVQIDLEQIVKRSTSAYQAMRARQTGKWKLFALQTVMLVW